MNALFQLLDYQSARKSVEMENLNLQTLKSVTMETEIQGTDVLQDVLLKLSILAQTQQMLSQYVQISVEMINCRLQLEKCVTMEILEEETDVQLVAKLKQATLVRM